MGNCLVKPSDKGTSSPRRNSAKPLEGDEAPKQLIEQPKKRFEVDDKDDQSIVSNSGATVFLLQFSLNCLERKRTKRSEKGSWKN